MPDLTTWLPTTVVAVSALGVNAWLENGRAKRAASQASKAVNEARIDTLSEIFEAAGMALDDAISAVQEAGRAARRGDPVSRDDLRAELKPSRVQSNRIEVRLGRSYHVVRDYKAARAALVNCATAALELSQLDTASETRGRDQARQKARFEEQMMIVGLRRDAFFSLAAGIVGPTAPNNRYGIFEIMSENGEDWGIGEERSRLQRVGDWFMLPINRRRLKALEAADSASEG